MDFRGANSPGVPFAPIVMIKNSMPYKLKISGGDTKSMAFLRFPASEVSIT